MKSKVLKLVKVLTDHDDWITANQLSAKTEFSVRSIKSYIGEINAIEPQTILSSQSGYKIDKSKSEIVINKADSPISQGSLERVNHLITRLIKSKSSIDIYDLSDELYVSLSTIKSDLPKIRSRIQPFNLELIHVSDTLQISGLEKNKRKMLSSLLYEESNESFMNVEAIQDAFLGIDVDYIKTIILDTFKDYHIFINDFSLISLILHISIAVDRIRNNAENVSAPNDVNLHNAHAYLVADTLAKKLESQFNIIYKPNETDDLALLIASCATTLDYRTISASNLEEVIGKETFELVTKLIQEVNAYYYINLNDGDFLTRFSLHIKNLLVRSRNNLYSKNPLTNSIKRTCPLLYETAVALAKNIHEYTDISINDDEIAYIAFHLGGAIETQRNLEDRVNCILYCPTYYNTDERLTESLMRHFNEQINIINIITNENDLKRISNADLILSTIPLFNKSIKIPILAISLFISQKDINTIFLKIDTIKKEKKRIIFLSHLHKIINPLMFRRNLVFQNENDAIETMCQVLVKEGYVSESFVDEIKDRERMSTTAFNNLAIPHCMKMNAKKTGMFVIINEKPTPWGNNQVNLILMLSINRNDRNLFNEVFENLTMILTEPEAMKEVLNCKTYDEFIQVLVERV
ncbi:MAG: BglG family transcription antiterminator [Erysipelotrichaceae bacterium]|nr:BglG family transcription antiterminator [Erysipelotrichaceae bacterium]